MAGILMITPHRFAFPMQLFPIFSPPLPLPIQSEPDIDEHFGVFESEYRSLLNSGICPKGFSNETNPDRY
jgi:hypothetical protein